MPGKLLPKRVKPSQAQREFFVGVFFWLAILQAFLLLFLTKEVSFVCNSGPAWPISYLAFSVSGVLTLLVTILLIFIAWRSLATFSSENKKYSPEALLWALIVATGISHTFERLSSSCILDYWQIRIFGINIHFNLGDIFLTVGAIALVLVWIYRQRQENQKKLCP